MTSLTTATSTNTIRSTTATSKMRMISNLALGRSWGPSCQRGLSSSILKEEGSTQLSLSLNTFTCGWLFIIIEYFYLWLMMSGQRRRAVSVSPSNWEQRSKVDLLGLLQYSKGSCTYYVITFGGPERPLPPYLILQSFGHTPPYVIL